MLDMNQVSQEETARFEVLHPVTDAPTGAFIEVYGKDSAFYRSYLNKRKQAQLEKALKKGRGKALTADDLDSEALDMVACMTKGWSGIVDGGKDVEFSTEKAMELYSANLWLKEQVDAAIHDRGLFING